MPFKGPHPEKCRVGLRDAMRKLIASRNLPRNPARWSPEARKALGDLMRSYNRCRKGD